MEENQNFTSICSFKEYQIHLMCNYLQINSVLNIRMINSTNEVNKTLADILTTSSKSMKQNTKHKSATFVVSITILGLHRFGPLMGQG